MLVVFFVVLFCVGEVFGAEPADYFWPPVVAELEPVVEGGIAMEYPYFNNIESMVIDIYPVILWSDGSIRENTVTVSHADYQEAEAWIDSQSLFRTVNISETDFDAVVDTLMSQWGSYGIEFNIIGVGSLYDLEGLDLQGHTRLERLDGVSHSASVVTIYLGTPNDSDDVGDAIGSIPSNRILVTGELVFNTISHEMGHCLGLFHIFEDRFNEVHPGPNPCERNGDLVCDTAPSPLFYDPFVDLGTCELKTAAFDSVFGSPWPLDYPDPKNHMSAVWDCRSGFTEGQKFRMFAAVESGWSFLKYIGIDTTPKNTPNISPNAEFPIAANSNDSSTAISVNVTHPDGYTAMLVTMDVSTITDLTGEAAIIKLADDGVFPDSADHDGIFTSPQLNTNLVMGNYSVMVNAYASSDSGGNHSYAVQPVEVVVEGVVAKFVNVSTETGMTFSGTPSNAVSSLFDMNPDTDLFVGISDDVSLQYRQVGVSPSGAPNFSSQWQTLNG